MSEQWRPIPGFEGRYEASEHGGYRPVRGGFDVVDIWPSENRAGHVPGAWDCPCGPWVLTTMEEHIRTVRHVEIGADT